MLFNSYAFMFVFLPVTLGIYFLPRGRCPDLAVAWLGFASIAFYSWWNWRFTPILLTSILINYVTGRAIGRRRGTGDMTGARVLLRAGVTLNLLTLGYFKYMNFFAEVVAQSSGMALTGFNIALPIGISFFTFTQIAFLADSYERKADAISPREYILFVTYFPHLIAGPILHHARMIPQFRLKQTFIPSSEALAVGLTVFVIGLGKKLLLADNLAPYADHAFSAAGSDLLTSPEAWRGVLAYTLQIYFDFSGYCDMAAGISRMFNITLPVNFESPYKSRSIIDFWRRWHITLSRFLRDYLYIPLGGGRRGEGRRLLNLMITMVLGGMWHGAGWNFLIWGFLHGVFLSIAHGWTGLRGYFDTPILRLPGWLAWSLTFFGVMVAWVFFRAPDLATAMTLLGKMAAIASPSLSGLPPESYFDPRAILHWAIGRDGWESFWLLVGMIIVLTMPNARQIMARHELVMVDKDLSRAVFASPFIRMRWTPGYVSACAVVGLFALAASRLNQTSQFLYFQF